MCTQPEARETRLSAYAIRQNYFKDIEKYLLGFESKAVENRLNVLWVNDEQQLVAAVTSHFKSSYNKVCFDMENVPAALSNLKSVKAIKPQSFENQENIPDIIVTEADFAVAETGEIALLDKQTKNCFNLVRQLVIILNINKITARRSDLDLLLSILSESKYGTSFPNDVKFIRQPFKFVEANEFFSSDEKNYTQQDINITVILYDDGVSELLHNENIKEAVYCIGCGLCAKHCPVFAVSGKYTPIALVRTGIDTPAPDKIFANTTFCGNCQSVCPVAIPFHELLTKQIAVTKGSLSNRLLVKRFTKRNKMNALNNPIRRFFFLKNKFSKNKKLFNYFFSIKEDFFNIQQKEE